MDPTSADRPQRPRTFTTVLRHIVRRPLLIARLVALGVLAGVAQSKVPQPWSSLIYISIMAVVVISITRSLDRAEEAEGPTES
ncbi:hypothetical protein ACTMTU_08090 [Streptomyces sp. OZ13]|uniref:hypothetical protein n=1 Tax=Streptomyces sp. OZ13 TaxID=3452210 RepID=UPI003F8B93B7